MLENRTTETEIITSFHSHPMSKNPLPDGLEHQFFINALSVYELEIKELDYIEDNKEFSSRLDRSVIYTLGMLMYVEYLTRELSRIEKLNGFHGKDIQMTGSDGSKRVTFSDLELEIARVQEFLHKQKTHAYN